MAITRGPSLQQALKRTSDGLTRAAVAALNRTAATVQGRAVREIAKDIGAKQKVVREAVGIRKASQSKPEAEVVARGKRIPIYDLTARQTQKGATYRSGAGRRLIPSAFIARMRSGHLGVFKRESKKRLPIVELFGPSIPLVFTRRKIQEALKQVIAERLPKEMESAARYFLRGGVKIA